MGTRTVAAIRLVHQDPVWYQGPPYVVREVVLDETDLEACYHDITELLVDRLRRSQTSFHPVHNAEDFFELLQDDDREVPSRYSNRRILRFDRVRSDGEILHPYAARRADNGEWLLRVFLIFPCTYIEMREAEFLSLPVASENDLERRANHGS
ncbi:conserved hypothetical protein [Paraburkholderia caribensis]|uniref:hypothetical protein n=1 Tax=Paraburkholderia caribensis TaxID=75105 RepID=UPI001CAEA965|nr:hypothetical protein [Paraburkholderia caribensis]CAG9219278.1 conserved hypothetical protein [Paraburkholderia caribensis]